MNKYPKVIFRESDHTYWYGTGKINSKNRRRLISVNKVWSKWCEPFNEDLTKLLVAFSEIVGSATFWRSYFSNYEIDREDHEVVRQYYSEVFNVDQYDLDEMIDSVTYWWNHGNDMGTLLHNQLEDKAYSDGFVINPFDNKKYTVHKVEKKYDNQSVADDLWDLEDGVYPELVVWDAEAHVCGQVDLAFIETIDGVRYVDIYDYKTNGGYSEKAGIKKRKELNNPRKGKYMKDPFSHLLDCLPTKYQGQVSMYATLLENVGFVTRNLAIGHFLNYDTDQVMIKEFEYLNKECNEMLKLHKEQHKP